MLRFPTKHDFLSLYAYKNIKMALKTTIIPGIIPIKSDIIVAIIKSIVA